MDVLFKRRFHYYFTDNTDIVIEFREWGIDHMLSMQHIDYTISKNDFFNRIDMGLDFCDFELNRSIKQRFKGEKERITMFSCIYCTLRYGRVFYIFDRNVPNTKRVKADYVIQRIVNQKGLNLGVRYENSVF
ncbi:MAG: hypothetical protein HFI84_03090 [Eubacterium sp.]|nr:hypothetical protein [Eubacterium sp.]